MPLPPIAVEVAPSPQKPELVDMLLDACSRAASPVSCTRADQPTVSSVSALAIVVWQPKGDSVRIQVGSRQGEPSGDWVKRRIVFEASDEESDRWTAAGFVVGTLASKFLNAEGQGDDEAAEAADADAASASATPEAPEDAMPNPAAPAERRAVAPEQPVKLAPRWLWVDAAAIGGPMFQSGPWRFGGMVGVAFRSPAWPVLVQSSFRRSQRGADANHVSANQTELDLGIAVPAARNESLTLDASLSLALQRLRVSYDEPNALLKVPQSHWVGGVRARLELGYQFMENVAGVAGAGLAWGSHSTPFRITRGGEHRCHSTATGARRLIGDPLPTLADGR